jgi:hypothetical protein
MSRHMTTIVVIVMLIAMVAILTSAVVRLENYRYANFVGACTEFDITKPQQRIEREKCLEATQTRTHWFWHVLLWRRFAVSAPREDAMAAFAKSWRRL